MQYKRSSFKKSYSLIDYVKMLRCNSRMIFLLLLITTIGFFMVHGIKNIFQRRSLGQNDQEDAYQTIWSKETVAQFENSLGLKTEDPSGGDCEINHHILSVLTSPGLAIDNYVWSYFALYSLGLSETYLQPVITEMLQTQLKNLFDSVSLPVINNVPRNCFDLQQAVILGYEEEVLEVQPASTPYLLVEHGKRWRDVMNSDSQTFKGKFRFRKDLLAEVEHELEITKSFIGSFNGTVQTSFVGIYMDLIDKPTVEYYKRSIAFMQKYQSDPIFIVVCRESMMKGCEEIFYDKEDPTSIRVLRHRNDFYSFALMSICNHTIISNEAGILHALYNGGDATVFEPPSKSEKSEYIPFLMAEYEENWYALA